jgi:hypothetical protein
LATDDVNTIVLLHCNGSDASTTFTDESGKTWTAAGNAQLDTAQQKFGTASCLFDGSGDDITTPHSVDFDFGTGAFTIDFWVRFASIPAGGAALVSLGVWSNCVGVAYFDGNLYYQIMGASGSIGAWIPSIDTWYHVALVRENASSTFYAYINGTQIGTYVASKNIVPVGVAQVGQNSSGEADLNGWIDELRISNVARWTANFTPSTSEYAPAATPTEINASIVIAPLFSGYLIKGVPGDLNASIVIEPLFSGTIQKQLTPELTGSIVISPQMSITLQIGDVGTAALTIPMLTLSALGLLGIDGVGYATIPMLVLTAEGYESCIGIGYLTIPALEVDGVGNIDEIGEASLTIPRMSLSGEIVINEIGNASLSIPMLDLSMSAVIGFVGTGAVSIPILKLSATGFLSAEGTANLTLPMLKLFAEVVTATANYSSMVMNIRNNALSLYTNYPFNSFCRFNGVHLGATSTKIYNLGSGTTDEGTAISWSFKTAFLDMELKTKKKLRLAWLTLKTDGDLTLTISYPDGTSYDYTATSYEVTEDGIRVKFGKGLASRYIALEVKNVSGSTLDLDTIRLQLDQYTQKR